MTIFQFDLNINCLQYTSRSQFTSDSPKKRHLRGRRDRPVPPQGLQEGRVRGDSPSEGATTDLMVIILHILSIFIGRKDT